MLQVSKGGAHQVRYQVMPMLDLPVDLGKRVVHPGAAAHQPVEYRSRPSNGKGNQHDKSEQTVRHQEPPMKVDQG
jgi:hypothetical protein